MKIPYNELFGITETTCQINLKGEKNLCLILTELHCTLELLVLND